jgi:hypothetical protein
MGKRRRKARSKEPIFVTEMTGKAMLPRLPKIARSSFHKT